jgi:hypothetical protein
VVINQRDGSRRYYLSKVVTIRILIFDFPHPPSHHPVRMHRSSTLSGRLWATVVCSPGHLDLLALRCNRASRAVC